MSLQNFNDHLDLRWRWRWKPGLVCVLPPCPARRASFAAHPRDGRIPSYNVCDDVNIKKTSPLSIFAMMVMTMMTMMPILIKKITSPPPAPCLQLQEMQWSDWSSASAPRWQSGTGLDENTTIFVEKENYEIFTFVCTFLFRFSSSLRLLNRVRYCSTCFSVFHQQVKRYFSWTYSPDNPDLWVLHELSGETSVILFCLIVIFKSASVSAILPISIVHVYIIRGTMLNEFKRGPPPDSPPMGVQDEK